MPFPPNFTNVYDTTFPPDTQLANLLGQDLRNFRTDVMQRLSLLSGTLANRPTPETVNATWGGVGYGLLYFSTDTSQVFQWNGSAWLDVTSSISSRISFRDNILHNHTGTITEDTIYTVNILAGALGTNSILRGTLGVTVVTQTNSGTLFNVKFGGTLIGSFIPIQNVPGSYEINFVIANANSAAAQNCVVTNFSGPSTSVVITNTVTAINTALAQAITISVKNLNNGDNQNFGPLFVEQM